MKRLTFPVLLTSLACVTILATDFAQAFPRGGGRSFGGGGAARLNTNVNLQNRGNINSIRQNRPIQQNRATLTNNPGVQNRANNINRTDVQNRANNINRTDVQNRRANVNNSRNVNISGNDVNINRDVDVDVNGRGWWGGGYYTPPGWGLATFGAGLVLGSALSSPPPRASTVVVNGSSYYYSDGVYVQPQGGSYVVVAPPVGAVVTYLPDGCSATVLNNTQSFSCSGVIYQPYYQNGDLVYQVVKY